MTVLYHMTDAAPRIPGTDAVDQEVSALEHRFHGSHVRLCPFRRQGIVVRFESLAGVQLLPQLLWMDRRVQLHHVFGGGLKHYAVFRMLQRPIVYTVAAGMGEGEKPATGVRRSIDAIVVASRRNSSILKEWGFHNVTVIPPGVDISRFSHQSVSRQSQFVVLAGSAPWVSDQFVTKGFDALFAAVARQPRVRLVLLWRGVLERKLDARLTTYDLHDRVEVVRERADVNAILGRVHATVVLAEHPHLIKEYPHSLIESLAAGKPVLVSEPIAMADYVRERGCGVVVPEISTEAVEAALDSLMTEYDRYQMGASEAAGQRDFCLAKMLERYQSVYESCGYDVTATVN